MDGATQADGIGTLPAMPLSPTQDYPAFGLSGKSILRRGEHAAEGASPNVGGHGVHKFNPLLHPRDARGRFIETGGVVREFGGGIGKVTRVLPNGRVEVRHRDGSVSADLPNRLTMIARADGSAPTKHEHAVIKALQIKHLDPARPGGTNPDDMPDLGGIDLDHPRVQQHESFHDAKQELAKLEHDGFIDDAREALAAVKDPKVRNSPTFQHAEQLLAEEHDAAYNPREAITHAQQIHTDLASLATLAEGDDQHELVAAGQDAQRHLMNLTHERDNLEALAAGKPPHVPGEETFKGRLAHDAEVRDLTDDQLAEEVDRLAPLTGGEKASYADKMRPQTAEHDAQARLSAVLAEQQRREGAAGHPDRDGQPQDDFTTREGVEAVIARYRAEGKNDRADALEEVKDGLPSRAEQAAAAAKPNEGSQAVIHHDGPVEDTVQLPEGVTRGGHNEHGERLPDSDGIARPLKGESVALHARQKPAEDPAETAVINRLQALAPHAREGGHDDPSIRENYKLASRLYREGRYDEANDALDRAEATLRGQEHAEHDTPTVDKPRTDLPEGHTGKDRPKEATHGEPDTRGDRADRGAVLEDVPAERERDDHRPEGVLRGSGGSGAGSGAHRDEPVRPAEDERREPARGSAPRSDAGGDRRGDEGARVPAAGAGDGESPADRSRPARVGRGGGSGSGGSSRGVARRKAGRFVPKGQQDLARAGERNKLDDNIAALRTLRKIQSEGRSTATPEEQKVLARWAGWGSLAKVVTDGKTDFPEEREEIKKLLGPAGWREAKTNLLNAHYTDAGIVDEVWTALKDLGFEVGDVLEPGSGSGNFIGRAPEGAHMTGVELNEVTASISRLLYPDADIHHESFGASPFRSGVFDAVVGNVPFGAYAVHDPKHNPGGKHSIHNHFILKSLDATKPGGVVAVITSTYSLDGPDESFRKKLFKDADLVGAVRLPNGAHKRTAGTDVTTDVLILRKRLPGEKPGDDTWVHAHPAKHPDGSPVLGIKNGDKPRRQYDINDYFTEHPDNILGKIEDGGYNGIAVTGYKDPAPFLAEALKKITDKAKKDGLAFDATPDADGEKVAKRDLGNSREGRVVRAGTKAAEKGTGTVPVLKQYQGGKLTDFPTRSENEAHEVDHLVQIRDAYAHLRDVEGRTSDDHDPELVAARQELNRLHDEYVAKYGPITRYTESLNTKKLDEYGNPTVSRRTPDAIRTFMNDEGHFDVFGLEHGYDPTTNKAKKADVFEKRQIDASRDLAEQTDDPADAIALTQERGESLTWANLGKRLGLSPEEAEKATRHLLFEDHSGSGRLIPKADYLSGNVRNKLREAEKAAETNPNLQRNVDALRSVMPADAEINEMPLQLGSTWIGPDMIERFAKHLMGPSNGVKVAFEDGKWTVYTPKAGSYGRVHQREHVEFGTADRSFYALLQAALRQQHHSIIVKRKNDDGSTYTDVKASEAATAKADEIAQAFVSWAYSDARIAQELSGRYNERFRSIVPRSFDDVPMRSYPGMAKGMSLRPHQNAAVARATQDPSVLLEHVVGAGKTYTLAATAMELRRLGMVKKPVLSIPGHMLGQWATEIKELYPDAKVLAVDSDSLSGKDARKRFAAKVAASDWDMVVMTTEAFESIPVSEEAMREYFGKQLDEYEAQLRRAGGDKTKEKALQKKIQDAKKKLEEQIDKRKDPDGITFESLGIDYIMADEAHRYKNLDFHTLMQGVQSPEGAGRARDMDMKLQVLRKIKGDDPQAKIAAFATGTPISNSLAEMYTMTRFLRPDLLKDAGIEDFDAWAATFARVEAKQEVDTSGSGYVERTRMRGFTDALGDALRIWRSFSDTKTADDLNLPRPKVKGGKRNIHVVQMTEAQKLAKDSFRKRVMMLPPGRPKKGDDTHVAIIGDGRRAALDPRLMSERGLNAAGIDPSDDMDSPKVTAMATAIHQIWDDNKHNEYKVKHDSDVMSPNKGALQMVFIDSDSPKKNGFSSYQLLKDELVARGMDPKRIRFIQEVAGSSSKKAKLFDDCRQGKVDVLVGSTEALGTGTNVQNRLVAVHHGDGSWKPSDIEQREGRILRQGNQHGEVELHAYVTQGTHDEKVWDMVAYKQAVLDAIARGSYDMRGVEFADDVDPLTDFDTLAGEAATDPLRAEQRDVAGRLKKLEGAARSHADSVRLAQSAAEQAKRNIDMNARNIQRIRTALAQREEIAGDKFKMTVKGPYDYGQGQSFESRKDAALALGDQLHSLFKEGRFPDREAQTIAPSLGTIGGFHIQAKAVKYYYGKRLLLGLSENGRGYDDGLPVEQIEVSPEDLQKPESVQGILARLENRVNGLDDRIGTFEARTAQAKEEQESAERAAQAPFSRQAELDDTKRAAQLLTDILDGQAVTDEDGNVTKERLAPSEDAHAREAYEELKKARVAAEKAEKARLMAELEAKKQKGAQEKPVAAGKDTPTLNDWQDEKPAKKATRKTAAELQRESMSKQDSLDLDLPESTTVEQWDDLNDPEIHGATADEVDPEVPSLAALDEPVVPNGPDPDSDETDLPEAPEQVSLSPEEVRSDLEQAGANPDAAGAAEEEPQAVPSGEWEAAQEPIGEPSEPDATPSETPEEPHVAEEPSDLSGAEPQEPLVDDGRTPEEREAARERISDALAPEADAAENRADLTPSDAARADATDAVDEPAPAEVPTEEPAAPAKPGKPRFRAKRDPETGKLHIWDDEKQEWAERSGGGSAAAHKQRADTLNRWHAEGRLGGKDDRGWYTTADKVPPAEQEPAEAPHAADDTVPAAPEGLPAMSDEEKARRADQYALDAGLAAQNGDHDAAMRALDELERIAPDYQMHGKDIDGLREVVRQHTQAPESAPEEPEPARIAEPEAPAPRAEAPQEPRADETPAAQPEPEAARAQDETPTETPTEAPAEEEPDGKTVDEHAASAVAALRDAGYEAAAGNLERDLAAAATPHEKADVLRRHANDADSLARQAGEQARDADAQAEAGAGTLKQARSVRERAKKADEARARQAEAQARADALRGAATKASTAAGERPAMSDEAQQIARQVGVDNLDERPDVTAMSNDDVFNEMRSLRDAAEHLDLNSPAGAEVAKAIENRRADLIREHAVREDESERGVKRLGDGWKVERLNVEDGEGRIVDPDGKIVGNLIARVVRGKNGQPKYQWSATLPGTDKTIGQTFDNWQAAANSMRTFEEKRRELRAAREAEQAATPEPSTVEQAAMPEVAPEVEAAAEEAPKVTDDLAEVTPAADAVPEHAQPSPLLDPEHFDKYVNGTDEDAAERARVFHAEQAMSPADHGRVIDNEKAQQILNDAVGEPVAIVRRQTPNGTLASRWVDLPNGDRAPVVIVDPDHPWTHREAAHEAAHLIADKDGPKGHGKEFQDAYLGLLPEHMRKPVAEHLAASAAKDEPEAPAPSSGQISVERVPQPDLPAEPAAAAEKPQRKLGKLDKDIVFDERYGNVSKAQLRAYKKHNVSPSDHDSLVNEFGEDNHVAITDAVTDPMNHMAGGGFSDYKFHQNLQHRREEEQRSADTDRFIEDVNTRLDAMEQRHAEAAERDAAEPVIDETPDETDAPPAADDPTLDAGGVGEGDPVPAGAKDKAEKAAEADDTLPEDLSGEWYAKALDGEKFDPTPEQARIHGLALGLGKGDTLAVIAKAGTGKTTTLEGLARRIAADDPKKRIGYGCFNASTAEEAAGRMPGNTDSVTSHALALRWSDQHHKDVRHVSGSGKESFGFRAKLDRQMDEADRRELALTLPDIARQMGVTSDVRGPHTSMSPTEQVVAARNAVNAFAASDSDRLGMEHFGDALDGLDDAGKKRVLDLADKMWADLADPAGGKLKLTPDHYRKVWALAKPDFSKPGWGFKNPIDVLFVDEAQDTSPVWAGVIRAQKNVARVVVGDPDQAINGFTGAIDYLDEAQRDAKHVAPLTKSFRYGNHIAGLGNRFLTLLKSKTRGVGAGPDGHIFRDGEMTDPDAILTRTNAGLIGELLEQVGQGRTVALTKGTKDDLLNLVAHARWLKGEGEKPQFPRKLSEDLLPYDTWGAVVQAAEDGSDQKAQTIARLFKDYGADGIEQAVEQAVDPDKDPFQGVNVDRDAKKMFLSGKTFDLVTATDKHLKAQGEAGLPLSRSAGKPTFQNWRPATGGSFSFKTRDGVKGWEFSGTPEQQEKALETLRAAASGGPKPDVVVSTAHKSKGLEWDRVKISGDFRGPEEKDGVEIPVGKDELMLAYVAVTRAKRDLDLGSLDWIYGQTSEADEAPLPSGSKVTGDIADVQKELADLRGETPNAPDLTPAEDDLVPAAPAGPAARAAAQDLVPSGEITHQAVPDTVQTDSPGPMIRPLPAWKKDDEGAWVLTDGDTTMIVRKSTDMGGYDIIKQRTLPDGSQGIDRGNTGTLKDAKAFAEGDFQNRRAAIEAPKRFPDLATLPEGQWIERDGARAIRYGNAAAVLHPTINGQGTGNPEDWWNGAIVHTDDPSHPIDLVHIRGWDNDNGPWPRSFQSGEKVAAQVQHADTYVDDVRAAEQAHNLKMLNYRGGRDDERKHRPELEAEQAELEKADAMLADVPDEVPVKKNLGYRLRHIREHLAGRNANTERGYFHPTEISNDELDAEIAKAVEESPNGSHTQDLLHERARREEGGAYGPTENSAERPSPEAVAQMRAEEQAKYAAARAEREEAEKARKAAEREAKKKRQAAGEPEPNYDLDDEDDYGYGDEYGDEEDGDAADATDDTVPAADETPAEPNRFDKIREKFADTSDEDLAALLKAQDEDPNVDMDAPDYYDAAIEADRRRREYMRTGDAAKLAVFDGEPDATEEPETSSVDPEQVRRDLEDIGADTDVIPSAEWVRQNSEPDREPEPVEELSAARAEEEPHVDEPTSEPDTEEPAEPAESEGEPETVEQTGESSRAPKIRPGRRDGGSHAAGAAAAGAAAGAAVGGHRRHKRHLITGPHFNPRHPISSLKPIHVRDLNPLNNHRHLRHLNGPDFLNNLLDDPNEPRSLRNLLEGGKAGRAFWPDGAQMHLPQLNLDVHHTSPEDLSGRAAAHAGQFHDQLRQAAETGYIPNPDNPEELIPASAAFVEEARRFLAKHPDRDAYAAEAAHNTEALTSDLPEGTERLITPEQLRPGMLVKPVYGAGDRFHKAGQAQVITDIRREPDGSLHFGFNNEDGNGGGRSGSDLADLGLPRFAEITDKKRVAKALKQANANPVNGRTPASHPDVEPADVPALNDTFNSPIKGADLVEGLPVRAEVQRPGLSNREIHDRHMTGERDFAEGKVANLTRDDRGAVDFDVVDDEGNVIGHVRSFANAYFGTPNTTARDAEAESAGSAAAERTPEQQAVADLGEQDARDAYDEAQDLQSGLDVQTPDGESPDEQADTEIETALQYAEDGQYDRAAEAMDRAGRVEGLAPEKAVEAWALARKFRRADKARRQVTETPKPEPVEEGRDDELAARNVERARRGTPKRGSKGKRGVVSGAVSGDSADEGKQIVKALAAAARDKKPRYIVPTEHGLTISTADHPGVVRTKVEPDGSVTRLGAIDENGPVGDVRMPDERVEKLLDRHLNDGEPGQDEVPSDERSFVGPSEDAPKRDDYRNIGEEDTGRERSDAQDAGTRPQAQEEPSSPREPAEEEQPTGRTAASEPETAQEPIEEPPAEADDIDGHRAEWVRTEDLLPGDAARVEGVDEHGEPTAAQGYVSDVPKAGTDADGHDIVTVPLNSERDMSGDTTEVTAPAESISSHSPATEVGTESGPIPQNQIDARRGLPERMPVDSEGTGVFPGATVDGPGGSNGFVAAVNGEVATVQWPDENGHITADAAPDTVEARLLTVRNAEAVRPNGWTEDGERLETGDVVALPTGEFGTVSGVEFDNVTVDTANGPVESSAGPLRKVRTGAGDPGLTEEDLAGTGPDLPRDGDGDGILHEGVSEGVQEALDMVTPSGQEIPKTKAELAKYARDLEKRLRKTEADRAAAIAKRVYGKQVPPGALAKIISILRGIARWIMQVIQAAYGAWKDGDGFSGITARLRREAPNQPDVRRLRDIEGK